MISINFNVTIVKQRRCMRIKLSKVRNPWSFLLEKRCSLLRVISNLPYNKDIINVGAQEYKINCP